MSKAPTTKRTATTKARTTLRHPWYPRSPSQEWRLEATLGPNDTPSTFHSLMRHVGRHEEDSPEIIAEVEQAKVHVPRDVVVTHDGTRLFAYATDRTSLEIARIAIERILQLHGASTAVRIERWDEAHARWWQVDPPPAEPEKRLQNAAARDDATVETRTVAANAGKFIRVELEQTMLAWADNLNLECEIAEHPHLLTTQVAFTLTGSKSRIEEFWRHLILECGASLRAANQAMRNPLAMPYLGQLPPGRGVAT